MTLAVPLMAAAGCWAAPAGEKESEARQTVKYGIRVQAGPMDSLLLKDYAPDSSLVVPVTKLEKARFPVIDVHTHTSMNNIKTPADVDAWVRTMDEVGIEKSIVLTSAVGDEFDRQVELYLRKYPDRFQLWCGILTENFDAPDYPQRAVAELERCYRMGARGVGEITDKGWGVEEAGRDLPRNRRLRFDDGRLNALWKRCGELKMPVNIHVADHPSCWQPLGPHQERTPDFQHFNMVGKDVPSYEELLAMRDRMLARHPGTIFIACHLSNQGHDTASLAKVLERYPNLYLDIAARDYELGRQPRTAAAFLSRYRDRILFGTDMGNAKEMYQRWWRLLETADEFMPGRVWWAHYGLALPPDVLRSLYRETALKVLTWE